MELWGIHTERVGQAPMAATEGAYFAQIEWLMKVLRNAGLPDRIMYYAIAQVMHETSDLTSALAQKYNNLSGIKYVKQPLASGKAGVPGNYAAYPSDAAWARDYVRVLSLQPGRPINATNAQEFYTGLYRNKYFEDPNYASKFNAKLRKVSDITRKAIALGEQYKSGNMAKYTSGDKLDPLIVDKRNAEFDVKRKATTFMHWVEDHPIMGAAILTGITMLLLQRRD